MRKFLFAATVATLPALAFLGTLWGDYPFASAPDDKLGLALNAAMPDPVRLWACDRALKRQPETFRPVGCW